MFNTSKKWVFFDKNEGPCGTLSEQSISCFSHCALCSYRGIGEICKSLERERNLPPVIEHTHLLLHHFSQILSSKQAETQFSKARIWPFDNIKFTVVKIREQLLIGKMLFRVPLGYQNLHKIVAKSRCLKITEKVSFNTVSEASYIYILSGQKLL